MVVESKSLSPSLSEKLRVYSAKNDVSISKDSVVAAIDFLANHTDLSAQQREDVVEKAVMSVHLRNKTHRNYEGDEQLDPKSFGKEVVLICTEKGIKIKRVPKDIKKEVKDKYEGFSDDVLDKSITILDMQPDLDKDDTRFVILESVVDTLNDSDSFDGGSFNYEAFGQNMRENLVALREAKKSEKAVDHLMDIFTGDEKYEGAIQDAYEYYDALYNLEDDDFEDYFDELFMEESQDDNYDGDEGYEYLFKKKKALVTKPRITSKTGQDVSTAPPPKPVVLPNKKQARKARREKQGSRVGNLLTGGVSGALKRAKGKIKAKKEAKKSKKATMLEMAKAKQQAVASEQPVPAEVTQTAVAVQNEIPQGQEWTGDSGIASLPEPITGSENPPAMGGGGSSGGGGGGGEMPSDMGGEEQSEEEMPEGEGEMESEEEVSEEEIDGWYPEDENWEAPVGEQLEEAQDESWYPENEDDQEIANFFGYKKKAKAKPETDNLYFENFTGIPESNTGKIVLAIIAVVVLFWAYKKFKG